MQTSRFLPRLRHAGSALALMAAAWCGTAPAATTDIGNAPLFTSSSSAIKPNILFILDDSGSMRSDYLPDDANFYNTRYGRRASQCNGVAYNPDLVYTLPVDAAGNPLPAADLGFITPDPATQTSTQRPLAAIGAMPLTVGSSITVRVTSSNRRSSWYDSGSEELTVFQVGDPSKFFVGTRTSWDPSSGNLTIRVDRISGTGSMDNPRIGYGEPAAASYFRYTGSQPRLGYTYTSSGVITSTTFYKECASTIGYAPGNGVFNEVLVTNTSAEAQNYANWYQYYRTRMAMMKSSVSLAFKGIDERYRVGYSTITDTNAADNDDFLNIRDFDTTQKTAFYTAFNNAQPTSYTPLRGALSKAGRYFANKAPNQGLDPVQYSCQRNFTILSTDGYWNTQDESTSAPRFGPYQVDNTTLVGQQDGGGTPRPMMDGGSMTKTTTQTWTVTAVVVSSTDTPRTTTQVTRKTTTTIAPVTGYQQYLRSLSVKKSLDGRNVNASCSWGTCYAVVDMSNHGYETGDVVVVAGGSRSAYRGEWTITKVNDNRFYYRLNTNNPGDPNSTAFTFALEGSESCSVGQGIAWQQRQTRDAINTTVVTRTTTTLTLSTQTVVTTRTSVTPYRRVIVEVNANIVNDSGDVAGVTRNTDSSTTSSTAGAVIVTTGGGTSTSAGFTAWTDAGAPTPVGGCVSSTSNIAPAALGAPTTSGSTVVAGPTAEPATDSNGTASTRQLSSNSTATERVVVYSTTSSGGSSNSLADVAAYYYNTDLRSTVLNNCTGPLGGDVCTNNVPGGTGDAAHSFGDSATWQHMTTFTLGLGVNGLLKYDPNYQSQLSGDFFDVTAGNKNWPIPGNGKGPENIDDLWHAAVNGRGKYFSAGDPTSLATSLGAALDAIKAVTGAASAASTSSLQPVEGDNDIYVAQFTTQKWVGDVLSFKIDPLNGTISPAPIWSAKTQLDLMSVASRNIYYANPSGAATLREFNAGNLSADGYDGLFSNFCAKTAASGSGIPTQCSLLNASDLAAANVGANLVNYLRGDQNLTYFRARDNRLGDIINASPLFVGKPGFKYTENGYQAFVTAKANRQAVVLAAANDGMLHAFDRITGNELWAFVPTFVMPNLYKLADNGYANNHAYFVDGSPQIGDVFIDGAWKTIVVGGLNAGGRGYYALDVTDPVSPKLMWEFRHDDLGLTFGNPIITKRVIGGTETWVVVFGSGYNNVSPGDGNGHLFVLNAKTGAVVSKVSTFTGTLTPAGDSSDPSGLARINSWVESELVNHSRRFYGGDLKGNLWRFDIDNLVEPHGEALLLARLRDPNGDPQSITVKPALAEVDYNGTKIPVVYVPTGRYLGPSDLLNTQVQSFYAIKDPLTNNGYGSLRNHPDFVTQTITAGTNTAGQGTRSSSTNAVNWASKSGWRADFPVGGERVSVNPQLALETIYVGTNLPSSDACTVGGSSFLYEFNIATGTSTATFVGSVMIQGLTLVQLTQGAAAGSIVTIITRSDGTLQAQVGSPATSGTTLRRTSWRELVD